MQTKARYSHLNGEEYLLVHRKALWEEVQDVIARVDASACRTKISREKTMRGRLLYSPGEMNRAFRDGFRAHHWEERRNVFWVTFDEKLLRGIRSLPESEQKRAIEKAGHAPIRSYIQTDFVKETASPLKYSLANTPSSPMTCSSSTSVSTCRTLSTWELKHSP
jgi:hypothetical protein